jgi:hypothetical protein
MVVVGRRRRAAVHNLLEGVAASAAAAAASGRSPKGDGRNMPQSFDSIWCWPNSPIYTIAPPPLADVMAVRGACVLRVETYESVKLLTVDASPPPNPPHTPPSDTLLLVVPVYAVCVCRSSIRVTTCAR